MGRFLTFLNDGQSCINCDYLVNGKCSNQKHIKKATFYVWGIVPLKEAYLPNESIYIFGSKCEDWLLIKPWEKKHGRKRTT